MWMPGLVSLVLAMQGQPGMMPLGAGGLEPRPSADAASPLQPRIDAAAPGTTIEIESGRYVGDLYLDRRVRLVGHGRPQLVGSGRGSVIHVRADGIAIEGLDIDARLGGSLVRLS